MTTPNFTRVGALLAIGFVTLSILTACTPSVNAHAAAEAYIRTHVNDLSPTPAVLGGTFYVTDIAWEDDDTAIVSYEDGHIALKARTNISVEGGGEAVGAFTIVNAGEGEPPSSSAGRGLGSFCGGIAAFRCNDGLNCQLDGTYPDAGGHCVR